MKYGFVLELFPGSNIALNRQNAYKEQVLEFFRIPYHYRFTMGTFKRTAHTLSQ